MTDPNATPSHGLKKIGQIGITVRDVSVALAYYRDVLGMQLLFEAGGMAFFDCSGVRLMLGPRGGEADHTATILYYQVDDIAVTAQALTERGVELIQQPHMVAKMSDHDLWMAFFRDLDGRTNGLMCEVRSSIPTSSRTQRI